MMWTAKIGSLYMNGKRLTDDSLRKVGVLSKLVTLDISNNPKITKQSVRHLIRCKNLTDLYMSNIPMDEEFLLGLAQIPQLAFLNIIGTGLGRDSIRKFKQLKSNCGIVAL